jgi:uncharacterized membrane protein YidH (DUF202 family)
MPSAEPPDVEVDWAERWGLWSLSAAAIPAAVGAGRVFVASRNDPQSLAAWLSSANLLAAWLSAALAMAVAAIALVPVVIAVIWLFPAREADHELHPLQTQAYIIKLGMVWVFYELLQMVFTGATTIYLAAGNAVGALSALMWVTERRLHRRPLRFGVRLVWFPVVAAAAIVVLAAVFTGTTGFPIERVQVEDEPEMSEGYVLSVDDVSLTLAYLDGGVRRIPTAHVSGRFICPLPRRPQLLRSPLTSLLEAPHPFVPDECDIEPTRRS